MYFEQITTPGLGCYSYVVGCPDAGVMAVVDPRRDTKAYLRVAAEHGMRITHILDTHVHADHISGAQQLRAETGADIYLHESASVSYESKKLKDGDEFALGNAFVRILHTPGHTPNSISLLISDLARSPKPGMILTGDLLFVGDAGRPDLPGEEILDEQIENLYDGLYKILGQLPDYLEVYPGHGQGSLCGQGMSAKPFSTLGYERLTNPMLRFGGFADFKRAVLSRITMRPQSFSSIMRANMNNVRIIPMCEDLTEYAVTADEANDLIKTGVTPLDLRDSLSFGAAHIPGSVNVDASAGAMLNWIGAAVPPDAQLILILPADKGFEEIRLELQRIGYDNAIKGWLKGGFSAWVESGLETRNISHISAPELRARLAGPNPPALIDVRSPKEFGAVNMEGSINLPIERIFGPDFRPDNPDSEAVVVCLSGFRAGVAASLLQARGCVNVSVLSGGLGAWETHMSMPAV